jgi:archaellum component FlaC
MGKRSRVMPDDQPKPSFEERLNAVIMTLELVARDTQDLKAAQEGLVAAQLENSRQIAQVTNRIDQVTNQIGQLTNRIDRVANQVDQVTNQVDRVTNQVAQVTKLLSQDGENIRALARIAEVHEHRLDEIQGQG